MPHPLTLDQWASPERLEHLCEGDLENYFELCKFIKQFLKNTSLIYIISNIIYYCTVYIYYIGKFSLRIY